MPKNFKNLLTEGKAIGLFFNAASPEFLEISAHAGFAFGIIDNEHGSWDGATNAHMIRAADAAGMVSIVRVSKIDETEIKHALDSGAAGILIPGVSSVEQAKAALDLGKFAPIGRRGACPYVRANKWNNDDKNVYFDNSNRDVAVIMLIEGKDGLANFDAIMDLSGVEYVFFGPCDLAVSLGLGGQDTHPRVVEEITKMIKKANAKGVKCGMMGFDGPNSKMWLNIGADFVCALSDVGLYLEICQRTIAEILGAP